MLVCPRRQDGIYVRRLYAHIDLSELYASKDKRDSRESSGGTHRQPEELNRVRGPVHSTDGFCTLSCDTHEACWLHVGQLKSPFALRRCHQAGKRGAEQLKSDLARRVRFL
jgi:hypothetical protein